MDDVSVSSCIKQEPSPPPGIGPGWKGADRPRGELVPAATAFPLPPPSLPFSSLLNSINMKFTNGIIINNI